MPGYELFGEEEKQEILDVVDRGVLFRYEFDEQRKGIYKVEQFEKEFAAMCGVKHALAVSSGTAALKVALAALGVGPGDEIITQGFTFVATWEAIIDAGALPVFTEIDETLCMDPEDLRNKISTKTRAIIPVHMCGAQARIQEILLIAQEAGVPVIEDTAQSAGGTLNGKYLGTFGDMGCFSFDSVKTMTTGEGGMIITDNDDLYVRASEFHDHGHDHNPTVPRGLEKRSFYGFNFRMMELQGAIGLAQLKKLPEITRRHRANCARIKEAIAQIPGVGFRSILDPDGDTGTFLTFNMPTVDQTIAVRDILASEGAGPIYWYDNTWHYYPQWEHLLGGKTTFQSGWPFCEPTGSDRCSFKPEALPTSDEIMSRTLSYWMTINMDQQIEKIVRGAEKAAAQIKA